MINTSLLYFNFALYSVTFIVYQCKKKFFLLVALYCFFMHVFLYWQFLYLILLLRRSLKI